MEMGRDLSASNKLDEGNACPLVGSTSVVLAGCMFVFVGESSVVEGRLGGCNNRCCCHGVQDSGTRMDVVGLGIVWENQTVGEVGVRTAIAAGP